MKKFNYLKFVGLLTILVIALVFVGINFLQAQGKGKKPPKIEEKWSVMIPQNGYNLYGSTPDGNTFTPNEFVITRISRPSKQCPCYNFYLLVSRPDTQGPGPYAINFQGVGIDSILNEDQGIPCVLPGLNGCLANSDCIPDCIADFLNNIPHPSPDYSSTLVRIQLDADAIDNIDYDKPTTLSNCGYIHISMYNGDPVIPERSTEIYHQVYGFTNVDGLKITKMSGDNNWIIEVDQPLEFKEQYREEYIYYRGKTEKRGARLMIPLEVETTPVKFQMIWTRVP